VPLVLPPVPPLVEPPSPLVVVAVPSENRSVLPPQATTVTSSEATKNLKVRVPITSI